MGYFKRAFDAYLGWITAKALVIVLLMILFLLIGVITQ